MATEPLRCNAIIECDSQGVPILCSILARAGVCQLNPSEAINPPKVKGATFGPPPPDDPGPTGGGDPDCACPSPARLTLDVDCPGSVSTNIFVDCPAPVANGATVETIPSSNPGRIVVSLQSRRV